MKGRRPGPATVNQLHELHALTVRTASRRIESGDACAEDLKVAAAICNDSGIKATEDVDVRRLRRLHSQLLKELLKRVQQGTASAAVLAVAGRLLVREGVTEGVAPKTDQERLQRLRRSLMAVPFRVQ